MIKIDLTSKQALLYYLKDVDLFYCKFSIFANLIIDNRMGLSVCLIGINNHLNISKDAYEKLFLSHKDKEKGLPFVNGNSCINVIITEKLLWIFVPNTYSEDVNFFFDTVFNNGVPKFNVTNKPFVDSLFIENISDNLLEIEIDCEDYYEYVSNDVLYGSQLNYSSDFETIVKLRQIEILNYKIQPKDRNYIINFKNKNIIEFSNYTEESEIKRHILELSNLVLKNEIEV